CRLNFYFRDVAFLSGIILTVLFYLTPIVYTLEFVGEQSHTVELQIARTPTTPFTESFRSAIYYKQVPDALQIGECLFIGIGGVLLGDAAFSTPTWLRACE